MMIGKHHTLKQLLIPVITLLIFMLIAPLSIVAKTGYNLQGWSSGEVKWAEGGLKGYAELDWVPFRVEVTDYDGEELKALVIEHGYRSKNDGYKGFERAENFKIVKITNKRAICVVSPL